jgi:uncharacterized repeat protein (TIGR03803 family)
VRNKRFPLASRVALAILTAVSACATVARPQCAQAQTFTVIHSFTPGGDGSSPIGLTVDRAGTFYGMAESGGASGLGTVFRLTHQPSGWVLTPLYNFIGGSDGAHPSASTGVVIGPNGSLYGTTFYGGGSSCGGLSCGTVFNLRPSPHTSPRVLGGWTETVLYRFAGGSDGANPTGDLIFDQAGNLYGTTYGGGGSCPADGCGTVYELKPSGGGGWTETVLYGFTGGSDGRFPEGGAIFDKVGNLYGTTNDAGAYSGSIFQLSPSESGWTKTVLHNFQAGSDGAFPVGGLIFDSSGDLYGTTASNGLRGGGTLFELSPPGGIRTFSVLYSFICSSGCVNGPGPQASLFMDPAGNLYGTTSQDGTHGYGSVFKLTPGAVGWTYTSLHDFTGGSDGGYPYSNVVLGANGNLYGTASQGGTQGYGVVWEIMP